MSYSKLKKLDLESLQQLQEGTGPSDKCICSLLMPPEKNKSRLGSIGASVKRAFGSIGGRKGNERSQRMTRVDVPLTFTKGGKGIYTTKETVKRKTSCGKCGCDSKSFALKHSYANIRIVSPDISSICPCPTDCLPDKSKLQNNIRVTVERLQPQIHPRGAYVERSQFDDMSTICSQVYSESALDNFCISQLIEDQYEDHRTWHS